MCLESIKQFKAPKYGYKAFNILNEELVGDFKSMEIPRPIEKILNSKDFRNDSDGDDIKPIGLSSYKNGWHVFVYREDAVDWAGLWNLVIKEVEIIEPIITGYALNNKKTVVCEKIRILREERCK